MTLVETGKDIIDKMKDADKKAVKAYIAQTQLNLLKKVKGYFADATDVGYATFVDQLDLAKNRVQDGDDVMAEMEAGAKIAYKYGVNRITNKYNQKVTLMHSAIMKDGAQN